METSSHDIVLIGGGGAGLRAAIAIAEANPNLDVAMVSKVYPMRSHTVSAEGGAAGVAGRDDTLDEHATTPFQAATGWAIRTPSRPSSTKSPGASALEHWGCPWSREPDGRISVRPFGGMKKMRTWYAADKTGFHMLHTLFQTSLKYTSITRYDENLRDALAGGRRRGTGRRRDRAAHRQSPRYSQPRRSSSVRADAVAFFPSPPTPISAPATGWRWRIAQARRSRTWRWSSTIRRDCPLRES